MSESWRRSSMCSSTTCVEVAHTNDSVKVRTSAAPDQCLTYSRAEWAAFIEGVKRGEFDLPPDSSGRGAA